MRKKVTFKLVVNEDEAVKVREFLKKKNMTFTQLMRVAFGIKTHYEWPYKRKKEVSGPITISIGCANRACMIHPTDRDTNGVSV